MATVTETQTVSRETVALLPAPPEATPTGQVDTGARAEALSWAPNTRRSYVDG